ncbi:ABC-F family ATP-binding cassette domain-containing protein [Aneurinibacillus sp. Ricciae_BoGa-3]|uniref:ABC-F family ATP-binding cassette domain-containing protein n=1 Tax=Aneurinibacillus sp. Ricciae_BoGa-3 TaxID=3022697 RepID=UPI00233FD534|nr:ABC-F family ATP-binding cassette domain-containing protein [Aneurinibacillus sp. Ricciae_BoGa-3]WCK55003.1 ABC-F family ATP-binding cassette domain-containing protein [Aneurinibacillus sp. Ricciae_BoGa-3]
MILLQALNIGKSFSANPVLSNINLVLQTGERVGLVGVNGAGKSTLLKIITGQMLADTGEIVKAKDVTLGYLAQDSGLVSDRTIWQELITVFEHFKARENELRDLEKRIADPAVIANEALHEKLMNTYSHLMEDFKNKGGYQYEATTRSILHGMRFYPADYDTPINQLSGGQKTRLALAKLLLMEPNVLVLDEPTNYLDIETLGWLEKYLQGYPGAVLVVSHDRFFLDALVNVIYELERTHVTRYTGNYSNYLLLKGERLEQQIRQFEKQQSEISRIEEFIQRNIVRASTTKRAQSRRKMLDKMDVMDKPPSGLKKASFQFDIDKVSGNQVITLQDVAVGYENKVLAQGLSFQIARGERVALLGPNGLGKSTLLKTIVGQIPPLSGAIQFGSSVTPGFYDQEQDNLSRGKQVLHELWDDYPTMPEKDVRTVLGNFLFSGDDVLKKVGELSGGERARVSLAKLMLQKANLLILDEPTNHLDLFSKEILEEALEDYPGTILFVSHDRYFLNKISTRVLEMTPSGVVSYLGNYDYYLEKKQELEESESSSSVVENAGAPAGDSDKVTNKEKFQHGKEQKKLERQQKRRIEELEKQIEQMETRIEEIEAELCKPEVFQDHEQALLLNQQLEETRASLDERFEEWTELQE